MRCGSTATTKATVLGTEFEGFAERLASRVASVLAVQPKALFSQAEAARLLRAGPTRTLTPPVRAKKIRSAVVNGTARIPFTEIERVQREGRERPESLRT